MTDTPPPSRAVTTARQRLASPRRVRALHALGWLKAGWQGFIAQPWLWLAMALASFAVMLILSLLVLPFIPLVGPLLPPVVFQWLLGGLLHASACQRQGQKLRFSMLFEGLQRHPGHLALVAVFYCIPLLLVTLITQLAIGGGILVGLFGTAVGGAVTLPAWLDSLISFVVTSWLLLFIVLAVMLMALVYAPALIMFRDCPPLDAMRLSLRASLRSIAATALAALIVGLLFLLALGTGGIATLVLIPIATIALHHAYMDVFDAEERRAAAPGN